VTDVAAAQFSVRVTVTAAWDTVDVLVNQGTTVAELKRRALDTTLGAGAADAAAYLVKFRGAAVLDEQATLADLGVGPSAPFIVLPRRRQPVR
jgi:hypothetical protein